jgi:hypothetical protein
MLSIPSTWRALLALALLGMAGDAWAQAAVAPSRAASEAAQTPAERPHITVLEDDNTRIEEHRVRGSVTRVTVQSKVGKVPAYEIQVIPPGRESMNDRGSQGKRTWSLLRF